GQDRDAEGMRLHHLLDDGLADLIDDDHADAEPEPESEQLAVGDVHAAGSIRSTASVQRSQRVGWSLCVPTSGRTCQQRSHFSPSASATTTPTPATSGRVNAPAGAAPSAKVTPEVMAISSRSMPSISALRSGER